SEISADAAHRRDVTRLSRVARVALLDRDDVEQAAAADAEAVRVGHAGYPRRLELAQQQRRTEVLAVAVRLVRRLVRRDAEDDRVVAVVDRLDLEHRFGALAGRVVPRPLAERSLGGEAIVMEEADEHDLRRGRDRQLR